jgi:hypothetical protein
MATFCDTHPTTSAKIFAPVGMRAASANQTSPRSGDRALAGRCAR